MVVVTVVVAAVVCMLGMNWGTMRLIGRATALGKKEKKFVAEDSTNSGMIYALSCSC